MRLFSPLGGVNHLYENKGGGRFEPAASVGSITTDSASSRSAAWGDFDGDGDLDLFVANSGPLMRGCMFSHSTWLLVDVVLGWVFITGLVGMVVWICGCCMWHARLLWPTPTLIIRPYAFPRQHDV